MLPATIPIFPLPNVVLFPNVFLPLHIFEPRYREMVADALGGDRIIGMTLLQPGREASYEGLAAGMTVKELADALDVRVKDVLAKLLMKQMMMTITSALDIEVAKDIANEFGKGRPAVYAIGCTGVITHSDRLSDGRYNIVLRGLERFRIESEDTSRAYRLAHVLALPEMPSAEDRARLTQQRQRLEAVLAATIERGGAEPRFPPAIADEDLVNALSQYMDLQPIERQALLECNDTLARCHALIDLLEMKMLTPRGHQGGVH